MKKKKKNNNKKKAKIKSMNNQNIRGNMWSK